MSRILRHLSFANQDLPIAHIDSPFGEISCLPSSIDIKPHFEPLGSSSLA